MTQPLRVVPSMTVMVTRRTLRRTQLLRPDAELNQLYLYCLAVMAQRHAIEMHALVPMSTHEHLIVTDTQGRLPPGRRAGVSGQVALPASSHVRQARRQSGS